MKLCLCLLLAACALPTYASEATDTFAATYSCPAERQTISRQAPPADIASDPERLEMWNRNNYVFNVAGCGQSAALECYGRGTCFTHPTTALAR